MVTAPPSPSPCSCVCGGLCLRGLCLLSGVCGGCVCATVLSGCFAGGFFEERLPYLSRVWTVVKNSGNDALFQHDATLMQIDFKHLSADATDEACI